MGNLDQSTAVAALKTPLGDNVLVLTSFTGSEGLGEPFGFEIEALSEEENIDFDKALGQACSIKLKTYENKERFFCGILVNAQWTGGERGGEKEYSRYNLVLRPWFWLLNHSADCRIFLNKDVTDIIEKVFTDLGFSAEKDYRNQLRQDSVLRSVSRKRLRLRLAIDGAVRDLLLFRAPGRAAHDGASRHVLRT
jgi:type VI secretion system secreted protein VgrG